MLVNSGYVVCHNTVLTYRHALFLLLLLASKKDKLNSRQRVNCIVSACMSNGCLTITHLVASGEPAKWNQSDQSQCQLKLSGMGGEVGIQPIGINHKAANMAITYYHIK